MLEVNENVAVEVDDVAPLDVLEKEVTTLVPERITIVPVAEPK